MYTLTVQFRRSILEANLSKGLHVISTPDRLFLKLVYGSPYSESTNYSKVFTLSFEKLNKYFEFECKNINKTGFNKTEKFFINIFERINKYIPKNLKKAKKSTLQTNVNSSKKQPSKIILPASYQNLEDIEVLTADQKKIKSRQSFVNLTELVEKIIAS